MKRILLAAFGAACVVLVPAMALAQEGSDLGKPDGPQVAGTGGSIGGVGGGSAAGVGGGSAFTGAEVAGLIGLIVVLAVLGVAVLLLTRRRATSAHGA